MREKLGKMPLPIVERLSVYLLTLSDIKSEGRVSVSSLELAERNGFSSAQVRKDLSCFGTFGKKGTGYDIDLLIEKIRGILGLKRTWRLALIGLGNLGKALITHKGFTTRAFEFVAIFEKKPSLVGKQYKGIQIYNIENLDKIAKAKRIEIAVLTIPKKEVAGVYEKVIVAGIPAALNFTPVRLLPKENTLVKNVNFFQNLETLTFYLSNF